MLFKPRSKKSESTPGDTVSEQLTDQTTSTRSHNRIGVVLVNTGSPEACDEESVKAYLKAFLSDPNVVPANRLSWWFILRLMVLPKRSAASAQKYQDIWTKEGAPLVVAQEKIAQNLEQYYAAKNLTVSVKSAMSYSSPSLSGALAELKQEGCTKLVVLPLYPQQSKATTGSVRANLNKSLRRVRWDITPTFISSYYDNATYLRAIAASIRHAGFNPKIGDRVLFSYHSLPREIIDQNESYVEEVRATSEYLVQLLGVDKSRWASGYMSQMGDNRSWLGPFSKDIIVRWALGGTGRVFVVCPNFSFDCLETLYDVDKEFRQLFITQRELIAEGSAADKFVYVPCLHQSKAHVKVLSDVLRPYVEVEDGYR